MLNVVTYTHPRTFCACVLEHVKDRGWRIQKQSTGLTYRWTLPNGISVEALVALHALVALCAEYATRFKLPVAYDPDTLKKDRDAYAAHRKRYFKIPKAKRTTSFGEFDDLIGKKVKVNINGFKATHIFVDEMKDETGDYFNPNTNEFSYYNPADDSFMKRAMAEVMADLSKHHDKEIERIVKKAMKKK